MEEKEKKFAEKKVGKIICLVAIIVSCLAAAAIAAHKIGEEKSFMKINTPYIELCLPSALEGVITYDESIAGDMYTCAFYLNYAGEELLLWRFDFGDRNAGEWIGVLKTNQGDVAVCMTAFAVTTAEISSLGEDGAKIYGECMQAYSMMVDGIMSDPRFSPDRPLAVGEDVSVKLTYWTVTLPDTMKVTEDTTDGNYEAVFSAEVKGEDVPLYQVCVGEAQVESFLGYFAVNGTKKPISVESFDLGEQDGWSNDDYAAAYRMMDTINDVIDAIMQSKHFSAEAE